MFEDHGRFMKHFLQNMIPASKCARNVLETSFTACKKCLLVDVLKEFNVPKLDMDKKRLGFADMKNILERFPYLPLPAGMEKYSKLFIYLPMVTLPDKLKLLKQFCVALSVSPKSNNLNSKSNICFVLNIHNLNGKTRKNVVYNIYLLNGNIKPMSAFLKVYDAATVTDNSILKVQTDHNCQHEFPTTLKHEANNFFSVDRVSQRPQVNSKPSHSPNLGLTTLSFVNKVSQLSFNFASKVICILIKKHQKLSSKFKKHSSDNLNFSKGNSELPTTIIHDTSLWNHATSPTCDPQILPCNSKVLQRARKRSSSFSSDLDTEFVHLPKAALEFLSYSSTSCPDMNKPRIYNSDSQISNSLPVQLSWLPYQSRATSRGCRTQLVPQTNPVRLWPRILLLAKCVCDGLRCAAHAPHRCTTIKVPVMSLVRDIRENGEQATYVRRQKEMLPVGCVCSEQKSVLLREHQPHILV